MRAPASAALVLGLFLALLSALCLVLNPPGTAPWVISWLSLGLGLVLSVMALGVHLVLTVRTTTPPTRS